MAGILFFLLAGNVFAAEPSGAREYKDNCARDATAPTRRATGDANEKPGYQAADLTQMPGTDGKKSRARRFMMSSTVEVASACPDITTLISPIPLWGLSFVGRAQPPPQVAEIVTDHAKPQPHLVGLEAVAAKPHHLDPPACLPDPSFPSFGDILERR